MTAADGFAITIRVATAADVDALARLRWQMTDEEGDVRESLADFQTRFREAIQRFEASGSWTIWVADAGDGMVGCLWLKPIERVPRPNRDAVTMGYVTNVYVERAWRNRGIGSRLLAAVREAAERRAPRAGAHPGPLAHGCEAGGGAGGAVQGGSATTGAAVGGAPGTYGCVRVRHR